MLGSKEYVGLTIQDDLVRVARLRVEGKKLKLVKLDRFSLVEQIRSEARVRELQAESSGGGAFGEDEDADAIFGLEEEIADDDDHDLDFSLESEDDLSLDMVDEAEASQSNELLFYNILSGIDSQKISLGLNIPSGRTIFQVIRDTNFKEVKQKDLVPDLEHKLESIYGTPQSADNYAYEIRKDGSLLLASIDGESATLRLVNSAREFYNGKIMIEEVIPDEMALVGLVRSNYYLTPKEVTAIIQFGKESCRVVFMKGEEVWLVSPIINEGTDKRSFLNTVFSKILFQLDTGEVPNLDRILIANNTLGESAINFFKDSFPDVEVEDIILKPDFIDAENVDPAAIPSFTTAIGTALAASDAVEQHFPEISLVPAYISERQKVFKLQWHGMLLLFLIFLTPITFNYFYNQNARQIKTYSSELSRLNSQIAQVTPVVEKANELSNNLSVLKEKLTILDTLSRGSREWSEKLNMLNAGMNAISGTWLTSMSQSEKGTFLQGYSLYRNRIPRVMNIFDEATLLNVGNEEIREKQVFTFSIRIERFAPSDAVYSPATPGEVKELIGK